MLELSVEDPELLGIDPKSITKDEVAGLLAKECGITFEEAIMFQLVRMAAAGNIYAIREVYDRLEGKPLQTSENKHIDMSYAEYLDSLELDEKSQVEAMFG
jgi:hypothetical protein